VFPEELAAASLVAQATGASIAPTFSGRHDAELTLPSGRTIGLEVTQSADSDEVETWAAIRKRQRGGSPKLNRWWSVALRSGENVKAADSVVEQALIALEEAGVCKVQWLYSEPEPTPNDPNVRAAEKVLENAGVAHANSVSPKGQGGWSFTAHKDGDWVDGRDVLDAVESEAWKPDNVQKIQDMATDERHLFVWVDYSHPKAHVVLTGGIQPVPEPHLPAELTTLWVAARMSDERNEWLSAGARRISPPGGWQIA